MAQLDGVQLPADISLAVANTLDQLYDPTITNQTTKPPSVSALTGLPAPVQTYLTSLTLAANKAANANACGSVLAGQGGEGDEFGDAALWLGDDVCGSEEDVLRKLGLEGWLGNGRTIHPGELDPSTGLPRTFKPILSRVESDELKDLLSRLSDKTYFYVDGGPNGTVAHILYGRVPEGVAGGWVALVGIGVAADY